MEIPELLKKSFVEPELDDFDPKLPQSASYVRRVFTAKKAVINAQLYMTALGLYRGYLNGAVLDEQLLTPGYTDYNYRVQYQSYDVTERIKTGENVIGAVVGDGWYRGCINIGSIRNAYGTRIKLAFALLITYEDGEQTYILSDESCKATQNGALRENNTKTIERYDATRELPDWNKAGYHDEAWHAVRKGTYTGLVIPQQGERILRQERFKPTVLRTPDGNTVLDFGQNFAGWIAFAVSGAAGQQVSITMGETLDESGNFTMKNLAAEGASVISGEVGQRLEYTCRDGRQTYEPFFQYCGFRYALLENWPEAVKAENFEGIAIYSEMNYHGAFTCSNELINQLVRNVRWSQKSNFVDIPGDCPTRERTGWTADIAVFCETACYLSDAKKFLLKWMEDYKLEQGEDGNLPFVVPDGGKGGMQRGCMGWSTAIAELAMTLYQFYGEKAILENVYDTVARFVQFNLERARKRNPWLLFRHYKHRDLIIEAGFHYGEWLEPGSKMYRDYIRNLFYPDTEVTTAGFYQTVKQLADMAQLLEKTDDMQRYAALAEKLKRVYQDNFLKDGLVESKRHCRYVRPLSMGLIKPEKEQAVAAALNEKCRENNYRIGTGFLTTWKLLQTLSQYGYIDTAYRILENTKQPGWLYAVSKNATTTWENWYGIDENGVPVDSHNHYAPGSVVAWLFSHCAGIRPLEAGFSSVLIAPIPGGSLTWAKAEFESVHGRICSAWRIDGDTFYLDVATPMEAVIRLPDGQTHTVGAGTHSFCCTRG